MNQPIILIIDEDRACLDVGTRMLRSLGFTSLHAQSRTEAIQLFQSHHDSVGLVLLDIGPPHNALYLVNRFKSINEKVKILLTSAYYDDMIVRKLLNQGCKGFIQKPFRIDELSKRISAALA